MASIITAGTSTGTALNMTGDTSGVLALATNNGTTAVTIDTSQNVGVGTASPTGKLTVQQSNNTGDGIRLLANGTDTQLISRYIASTDSFRIEATYASTGAYKPIAFYTSDAERMRITSTGAVGIGTSAPSTLLHLNSTSATTLTIANPSAGSTGSPQVTRVSFLGYNGEDRARIQSNDQASSASGSWLNFFTANTSNVLTEQMRINQYGNMVLAGGTTTANGTGITFPATQSASSDANCLDDYEEGTWSPVPTAGSGSITTYSSSGFYTKIGRMVTVNFYVVLTNVGTASGGSAIVNFPFAAITASGRSATGVLREDNYTGLTYQTDLSGTTLNVYTLTTNANWAWTNGYAYTGSITYQV